MNRLLLLAGLVLYGSVQATTDPFCTEPAGVPPLANPVVFVTQFPIADDFATIGSVFANHTAEMQSAGRGGDLYIRYPNGRLCNLTREAGFGVEGFQGAAAIAVRDPSVNAAADRLLFSMVVGAPSSQFEVNDYYWQLYELTGLGPGEAVVATPIAHQPTEFNNIMPIYGSDGRIIFVSDRPRNGARHLYPQHDEYESTATNTGLWSLDPNSGDLILLQHSPSGSFDPLIDQSGRLLFTRWDHLQRDQQADADSGGNVYGTFDYADESESAATTSNRVEVFPEPRASRTDLLDGTNLEGHSINHFFPWMINQDGSGEETLNHIGRHELHEYFNRSMNDDDNLIEFIDAVSGRTNPNAILNMLQLAENPQLAGAFYGVDAPEFQTHASGRVVQLNGQPGLSADQMVIQYVTHPITETVVADGDPVPADHSGHYREPLPMTDGAMLVVHTDEARAAGNDGTRANPDPRYDFSLKLLTPAGNGYLRAGSGISGGITRNLSYFDPDVLVSYNGPMWELNPVEIVARTAPPMTAEGNLAAPEQAVFDAEMVDVETFRQSMIDRGLALMVVRDITTRDDADLQQAYNLEVPGGISTIGSGGKVYDVSHLQFFQGDQVRGIGGISSPRPGRRVLARHMHNAQADALNLANPGGPQSSVAIAADGSVALFVPTRRAMSWQSTEADGTPVLRERYWITFQPGEVRVCDGCHGVNEINQVGESASQNQPQALHLLLQKWKLEVGDIIFSSGFEATQE